MKKIDILGVPFDNITFAEAAEKLDRAMAEKEKCAVATPNPEIVQMAFENEEMKKNLLSFDMIVADGIGVIYAAKILKTPIQEKIAGIDLGRECLSVCAQKGYRVFFLGAAPGIAEKAAENMKKSYPNLLLAGVYDGYFQDDNEAIEAINSVGSIDLLFVCLGAPKQEKFIASYKETLNATVLMGLGGSLDVFAGNVKRAPKGLRKMGLEWLYRLLKEPKRIGRMLKLPVFLWNVVKVKREKRGENQ